MTPRRSLALIALLAGAAVAFTATDASARGLSRSSSVHRSAAHAWGTRSVETQAGRGGTRSFDRSCASGTCERSSTTVTNSGKTWSRSGTSTRTGDGSASWSHNATGPNGGSIARDGNCTSGEGCNGSVTVTKPNGDTKQGQWVAVRE
jgi:hypothetical protein